MGAVQGVSPWSCHDASAIAMVNWNDPVLLLRNYQTFDKLTHVAGGIYIWEFVTHLDFDWHVLTGARKYRWTYLLYSGCRLSALFAVVTVFTGFDAQYRIKCQAWVVFTFILTYLAFVFASVLIVLRIMAIWECRRLVVIVAWVTWLANTAFYIHSVITARSTWFPEAGFCVILHSIRSRINIIATLVADLVLVTLMLFGLLRWQHAGQFRGVCRFLYNQGLIWIVVVTLAEVPSTVMIVMDLDDPWNLMFQVPELITMAIGATRIYRGLADYTSITELRTLPGNTQKP
ncbi:hypothetical protein BV25DRAFT_1825314 [Artomyces pyxidatus]|uniref:Uncharacterized protein n=1 Tax=Artomyces pyxidatus TaxID=48021 RepID=A0ACB8T3V2_9AGAM|nr:hypothetical protein BV25DRAFT_1825314 [Artomyces pyxidatus]